MIYRAKFAFPLLLLGLTAGMLASGLAGEPRQAQPPQSATPASAPAAPASAPALAPGEVMKEAVAGIKNSEHALYLYERIERVESRKEANDATPQSVRVSRVVPAGTGIAKISLGPDGKPTDADAYRAELTKLLNSLVWAAESGQPQREAYQKIQKKQKDRDDLIEATKSAFLFTYVSSEPRGDRTLAKYRMEPNPAYHPTNRSTSIFSRVKGFVWIDESSHQLARVEGEVTDDISLGLFLAKVYKGSRFMQDRYEQAPGLWMPSFTQYDFDGRKFFSSFGVHEKTFYRAYKKIGTPAEAIPQIQAELAELNAPKSADNR